MVKADKDGIVVSKSDSAITSRLSNDGVDVFDGTKAIASFGSGAVIPSLYSASIRGDVINIISENVSLNIGPGQTFDTITSALGSLGDKKYLKFDVNVDLNVYGEILDTALIGGFTGIRERFD